MMNKYTTPMHSDSSRYQLAIRELRETILDIGNVQCDMYHEQIDLDSQTLRPKKNTVGDDVHYKRPSLCPKQKRMHWSCAHTEARNYVIKVSRTFSLEFPQAASYTDSFITELRNLEMAIVKIDADRHYAEVARAQLLDFSEAPQAPDSRKNLKALQMKIAQTIEQHRQVTQQLIQLRDKYLRQLESTVP